MDQPTRSVLPGPDACRFRKEPNAPVGQAIEDAVEIAERLLRIDPASSDLVWVRDQVAYYFATRDPADTEFSTDGGRTPRYRWEHVAEGEEVGWLVG